MVKNPNFYLLSTSLRADKNSVLDPIQKKTQLVSGRPPSVWTSGLVHNKMILIFIVSLLAISLTLYHLYKVKDNITLLTINGEPVSKAEFITIMSGLRANIYSYFSLKYGANDNIRSHDLS